MSKPKTCGYSQTYPIGQTGQFQKIWVEYELDETDDPRQELYRCKKIVNDFFFESNKAAEKQQQVVKEEPPQSQEAKIIADIYTVKDLKVLESYKIIAKKYPAIQAAYDQMFLELSK
jgi:uncharacterized Ntn-hydrolase superfamily protein